MRMKRRAAIARLACACSAAVICSKSLRRSTSSPENVRLASSSISPGGTSRRLIGVAVIEQRLRQAAIAGLPGFLPRRSRRSAGKAAASAARSSWACARRCERPDRRGAWCSRRFTNTALQAPNRSHRAQRECRIRPHPAHREFGPIPTGRPARRSTRAKCMMLSAKFAARKRTVWQEPLLMRCVRVPGCVSPT